jgi:nickel-dependent lactate racemase
MISHIRFGAGSNVSLDLGRTRLVAHCDGPRGVPLGCVGEATDRLLAEPLEFPPLAQAILPGDSIVLALAEGVPRAATIVARVVEVLLSAGVSASNIRLLRTQADAASGSDPTSELSPEARAAIECVTHDPANRAALSYLAATSGGDPIYIDRSLHDADFVITFGCLRPSGSLGYHGIHSALYPSFSDERSLDRFRSPKSLQPRERERLDDAANEVAWLLGVQFTVQVVPGEGEEVLHVLAGDVDAVLREGSRLCEAAWAYWVPERANLAVTTIEGAKAQQTWDNVARALAAASRVVSDDGDVAICCDLADPPGPAVQRIAGADDPDAALRAVRGHRPADALAAAELAHALKRGKVYLLSRLDSDLVEDLGMTPIAADQIPRLVARYDACIVLSNSQYVLARPRDACAQPPALAEPESRP